MIDWNAELPKKTLYKVYIVLALFYAVCIIGVIISALNPEKTPRWEDVSNAELPELHRQMLHEDSIAKGLKTDTLIIKDKIEDE